MSQKLLTLQGGRIKVLGGSSPLVPYFIPSGETFVIPENSQGLTAMEITIEGTLDVEGYLVEVE